MDLLRLFTFSVTLVLAYTSNAQTYEYADGRKLVIEFVQEPPCPVKMSVKSVDLKGDANSNLIMLQIENRSPTAIRAYAMVSGGDRHPNMHTTVFGGKPFAAGETIHRGVWPNSQEHYYFFFDYILFDDGTVCGVNNHRRSIQIKSYLDSRAAAITRLRELGAKYPVSDEIVTAIEKGPGYLSFDNPGPPNPDTIKSMPRRAYEHIVFQLRNLKTHPNESTDLADRLEKEIPR
jgi:hypothetical protein